MAAGVRILDAARLGRRELDSLALQVQEQFGVEAGPGQGWLDLQAAFDVDRQQYCATTLVHQVRALARSPDQKWVAVVEVDLFVPVLTYVFGEAELNGTAAVISTQRLHNQYYGLPRDDDLAWRRLEKEVLHELGHTFGLYHCHQFECVMRSSTYVEEIDLKRAALCPDCSDLVRQAPRP